MSKRHDQRGSTATRRPVEASDITWMAPLLEDLRETWGTDLWFGADDVDPTAPDVAEQRLRKMTNRNFLEMKAVRNSEGVFERFEWKVA